MPNLPYQTSGWNTHSEVATPRIEYPLFSVGVADHIVVTRIYEGPLSTYAAEALDTADVDYTDAYLVEQGDLQDIGGGCVRYTRTYATVPDQWSLLESFAFTFPAYPAGTAGTSFSVTSIAAASLGTVILGTSATGISVGETVIASVAYTRGGVKYTQTFQGAATAVSSGSSVTLPGSLLGSVGSASAVSGTVQEWTVGRSAAQPLVVGSRIVHDYALSDLASLDEDLPLSQQFRPVDSTGVATDTLSASSVPTSTAYATSVAERAEICAEASVRRRYMGNIYVRATRLVPAS